jgi:hypothetical protein
MLSSTLRPRPRFSFTLLAFVACFAPAALVSTVAAKPTPPQRLSTAERDSVARAIEKDRADTDEDLRSGKTSYLATVIRVDFGKERTLGLGRASDNAVVVADPEMPEHALRVTVVGDSFHVEAVDGAAAFIAGRDTLRDAMLPPAGIRLGRWTIRLSHQRYPALIVFDPRSPRFSEYRPIPYFPVDLAYRFVAPLTANPRPDTVIILSTRGNERRALLVGWFDVLIAGKPCRLEAHRLLEPGIDEKSVSVFFRDATTGRESYGVGRYVDPEPLADGRWVLDFNNAYDPACAFSPHYNCPIPSKANTLKVAVRAGARDPHAAGH